MSDDKPAASMKVVVTPRQYSVMIYDRPGSLAYSSSANVFVYGDRGYMYTINGNGFYTCLADKVMMEELFSTLHVKSLEGWVSLPHARLLRVLLRNICDVRVLEDGDANTLFFGGDPTPSDTGDTKMAWVRVAPK